MSVSADDDDRVGSKLPAGALWVLSQVSLCHRAGAYQSGDDGVAGSYITVRNGQARTVPSAVRVVPDIPRPAPELRIVTGMELPSSGQSGGDSGAVSRRGLLSLAGAAGIAVTVGGCADRITAPSSPASTPQAAAEIPPTATNAVTPGVDPVASPAPAQSGTTAVLLCRDAWGARPARPGGRPHTINRMTIHHTAVFLGDNRKIIERLRQHQRFHQDKRGWIDIAYHIGIDRAGNIYELRSTDIAGDTATNYDPTGHFLVLCEGNFEQEAVTDSQLHGAALAFAWASQKFDIPPDTLASHRDVSHDTTCPGANLYARVTSGELNRRIEALLASGPVNLRRVCGAEAAQTVAAIEAG